MMPRSKRVPKSLEKAPEAKIGALRTFAAQLKAWRHREGLTQVQLAKRIMCSPSLISYIESCEGPPQADFAKECDNVFGTPETFQALQELVAREAFPAWFAAVVPLEQGASRIHGWELGQVPGLFQTEDYARALIQAGRPGDDPEDIEQTVTARMERQAILTSGTRPHVWYVMHEAVLRQIIGGPVVMCAQLDRLAELAEQPNITVQVLQFASPDNPGAEGPIVIYETDAGAVAYTECSGGGRQVEESAEVDRLQQLVGMLRATSLSPRDSVALIRDIRREL
jgi:transcriptional regulator with XRE-family HTH domain